MHDKFPREFIFAEAWFLAAIGLVLLIQFPVSIQFFGTVALGSLFGMIHVSPADLEEAERSRLYKVAAVVGFVIGVVPVTMALVAVLNIYAEVVPSRVAARIGLYFLVPICFWVSLGALAFLAVRFGIATFRVVRKPIRTGQLISYVWFSRQFGRSILDEAEFLPGYPLRKGRQFGTLIQSSKDAQKKDELPDFKHSAILGGYRIGAFICGIAFKLALPLTWPLAYLAQSSVVSTPHGKQAVFEHFRSRLNPIVMFLSIFVLAADAALLVININRDPIVEALPRVGHSTWDSAWVLSFSVWNIASAIAAMLYLATARKVDAIIVRATDLGVQAEELRPEFRIAIFGMRVRALFAGYSLACVALAIFPSTRVHLLPIFNPILFEW